MRDHITLGPTPVEEDCAQVGLDCYPEQSREECIRYRALLEATFGDGSRVGCSFGVKAFPHDFGTYREVVVYFDVDVEEQVEFAYNVEANMPLTWRDTSDVAFENNGPGVYP